MTTLGELLYGLRVPVAPQAGYALRRPSWDLYGGDPHHACHMTAFCRNPLHPGPCKGWKKHLGLVSPGALHALEKLRFEKLEAQRKAKLKQHLAEGKKVPAKLLKPIEYNPERNKDIKAGLADLDLVKKLEPPSAPTKKEIEAKLADKHAGQLDELVQSLDGTNSDVLKTLEKHPNQYVNLTDQQKSEVAAALDAKIQIGTPDEVAKAQALKGKLNIPDPPKPKKPEVTKAGPAQYDSLKSAGLSTGSKVFLHVAHDQDGNAHPAAKGTKGFTTPVLVTVGSKGVAKQSKGGAGGGKVTMSTFTTEDGEVIDGGAHNSKFWMSPASSHPFAEKSGPSAGAPAAAVTSTEEKKGQVADILAAKKASAGIDSVVKAAKMAGASSMVSEKQKSNLHAKLVEAHETGNLSTIEKTAELSAKTIAAKTKEKTGIKLKDDEQKKLQNELDNAFKGGGDTPILDSIDAAWKNPKKLSDMLDALGVPDPFGPDLAADLSKIKPHTQADTYLDHAKAVAGGKYDSNPLMAANLADLITKEQYENDLTSSQKLDLTDAMHQAHTVGNQVVKDKANAVMLKLTGDPIDLPEPPASPTGSDGSLKSNPVAKALELGKSNAAIVSFMEDFPESWDTLTPEQKNEVAGKLHSEYLVGPTTTAIKAENLIKKYDIPKPGEEDVLGKLLDAVPMSTGYLGSGTVPPPHVKNAIDLANGFKSGTAKQKVAAFDQLTPEEYGKLDPNTQKLIQDSLLSAQAKFVDPKKKAQAKAIADKLSVGAGGGAGAGGAGSSTAPPPIGVPSGKLGADTFAPPAAVLATKAEVADKLAKHAGELGLPAHIDAANMTPAASTWLSTSALDNAIVDTGIDGGCWHWSTSTGRPPRRQ